MKKSNLHTHTVFCDGQNTPEEMVLAAIGKGFDQLGFSGHSYTFFDESYCMSREGTAAYHLEIRRLKEKYAEKIDILCGIEQDYFSKEPVLGYDFVIGSVHYVEKDGDYYPVDESPEDLEEAITQGWGGDTYAFLDAYFDTVTRFSVRADVGIIGHFDLVGKFNRQSVFFDEGSKRYRDAAESALDKLAEAGKTFEINTGAMARGYLDRPYPDFWLLEVLKTRGAKLILSSDCHDSHFLDYGFSDERLLKFIK